jgi:D-galactose 1-dehydrogenase
MSRIRIALVGIGKIARDQHVPSLAQNEAFQLVATVSRHGGLHGLPNYSSVPEMLAAPIAVDAVAICTPPQVRFGIARDALRGDLHVLLEKPPGATLNEVHALLEIARAQGVALYASWHSRAAAGVAGARDWLAARTLRGVAIDWKEDVREWHPGQSWIWRAGGFGVFDPGINALSIATEILPAYLRLDEASLSFPANCDAPIAATLRMSTADEVPVSMALDFLHPGPPIWNIDVQTTDGNLSLSQGGAVLQIGDGEPVEVANTEYPALYAHFEKLVRKRAIDVDTEPLRLVADAFLCGRRTTVAPFVE